MLSVSNIYAFAMRTVLHQELEKPVSTPTNNTQQPMIMTVPNPLPTSDNTPKIRHFDFSTDECHHYPVDIPPNCLDVIDKNIALDADIEKLTDDRKKLIGDESKLLEDHRKANKDILTRHFYDMSNMMSRNEGVWLSNGWVKTLLWIFLPCFLYTVISIAYFVASYIDKYAEDRVMWSHLILLPFSAYVTFLSIVVR